MSRNTCFFFFFVTLWCVKSKTWLGDADEIRDLCDSSRSDISTSKKSLKESSYTDKEKLLIWDFYVSQYDPKRFSGIDTDKISAFIKKLMNAGDVAFFRAIRTKRIDKALTSASLNGSFLCLEHPRIVLARAFSITSDENETLSFSGGANAENELSCFLRHIRNSLAHNNTYFFDNGNILLEDKNGNVIDARILIHQKALIDWVPLLQKTAVDLKRG